MNEKVEKKRKWRYQKTIKLCSNGNENTQSDLLNGCMKVCVDTSCKC